MEAAEVGEEEWQNEQSEEEEEEEEDEEDVEMGSDDEMLDVNAEIGAAKGAKNGAKLVGGEVHRVMDCANRVDSCSRNDQIGTPNPSQPSDPRKTLLPLTPSRSSTLAVSSCLPQRTSSTVEPTLSSPPTQDQAASRST